MEMEKYLAGVLTALMAISVLAVAGLGELALQKYPGFEGKITATDLPLIVVGAGAHPVDIVGAVDIAVTLAELSTTKVPIPGVEPEVNGKEIEGAIRGDPEAVEVSGLPVKGGGYSKFMFYETITDAQGVNHSVVEKAVVDIAKFDVNVTDTFLNINPGGVKYVISFTPAMPVGEKIKILGKEYELIEVTDTTVKLGETKETAKLAVGESDSIGPYKISVYGITLDGGIKLTITKDTTALAGPTFKNIGENVTLDDGKLKVEVKDIFVGYEAKEAWIIVKLTWVNTVLEEGKDSPFDTKYLVPSDGITVDENNNLASLTLENKLAAVTTVTDPATQVVVKVGESFAGPADYFKIIYRGLSEGPTEKIVFDKEGFVTFNDKNRLETKVNVSALKEANPKTSGLSKGDVIAISGYAVEVKDANDTHMILTHRAYSTGWIPKGVDKNTSYSTGYGFSINIVDDATGDYVESDGKLESSLGAKINNTFDVSEEEGVVIDLVFDAGKYNVTVPPTGGGFQLTSENSKGLTNYGSVITLGAGRETVEIVYPDKRVNARALVGELAPAPEQVVEKYTPIVGAIGKLDTDPDLKPAEHHVIIVGGPYANILAAQFYNLTFPIPPTVTAEEVASKMGIPAEDGNAVIEVKEGVFGAGKLAIVVAGWSGLDTRLAARVLQEHATRLKDITTAKVVISGTELATATIEGV